MSVNKKMVRRKSYKNMSVSELVKAREDLVNKMTQIDDILNQAVKAVGFKQNLVNNVYTNSKLDPFKEQGQQGLSAQVAIAREQPTVVPRQSNAADQSTAFSIFDAESYNADVEAGVINANGPQYLVDTPGQPVNSKSVSANTPVGLELIKPLLPIQDEKEQDTMSEEMNSLMSEVSEGLKNVKSTQTIDED